MWLQERLDARDRTIANLGDALQYAQDGLLEERELREEIVDGSFERLKDLEEVNDDLHSIIKENAEDLQQMRTPLEDIQVENARLRKVLSDAGLAQPASAPDIVRKSVQRD
ncbi:hypothetical protein K523DRAFT_417528 [Schizophyllum commune Tattone D]|nr:hypothetical protein K525DRAFT_267736 [Schizophyllum commune Loenen D]KAI5828517.1 hypothetical protein K523DRAFT_417528 [Schizophyllum commune Tattone D]